MMKWLKNLCDGESAKVNVAKLVTGSRTSTVSWINEELARGRIVANCEVSGLPKQQMQWAKKSAHLVLQMRTQVLDERLEDDLSSLVSGLPDQRLKHPLFYALHACAEHLGRSHRSLLARCR
jgi:hypothetical protein